MKKSTKGDSFIAKFSNAYMQITEVFKAQWGHQSGSLRQMTLNGHYF